MGRNSSPFFGGSLDARVAELVDALDSGSSPSNGVQVQLLPRAPSILEKPKPPTSSANTAARGVMN